MPNEGKDIGKPPITIAAAELLVVLVDELINRRGNGYLTAEQQAAHKLLRDYVHSWRG